MSVPFKFATKGGQIVPASQLDADFAYLDNRNQNILPSQFDAFGASIDTPDDQVPDETAQLERYFQYCADTGFTASLEYRKYGFTNGQTISPNGHLNIVNLERPAQMIQLSGRDASALAWQFGGSITNQTTLSVTAASGSNTIEVADATGIVPGSLLDIKSSRLLPGDHRFDPNNCLRQLARVRSVSGTEITLDDVLRWDFVVGTITSGVARGGDAGGIILSAATTALETDLLQYPVSITAGTGAGQTRYIQTYSQIGDPIAVSGLTWSGGTATCTISAEQTWTIGDVNAVTIAGASPSGWNGTYVATPISLTACTFQKAANPGTLTVPGTCAVGGYVDIGTTFTGFPDPPWNPAPDSTSSYSVPATAAVRVIAPMTGGMDGIIWKGYFREPDVVRGLEIYATDAFKVSRCKFSSFSKYNFHANVSYMPIHEYCVSRFANNGTASGGGEGYGFVALATYFARYSYCYTSGCRSGYDVINGAIGTARDHCVSVGGGKTYDGRNFFPTPNPPEPDTGFEGDNGYECSGLSTHTGGVDTIDSDCIMVNIGHGGKYRGINEACINLHMIGASNYGLSISYVDNFLLKGATYRTGWAKSPTFASSGWSNKVDGVLEGEITFPVYSGQTTALTPNAVQQSQMMGALVNIRCGTLQPYASICIEDCDGEGMRQSLVWPQDQRAVESPSSPALTIRNCRAVDLSQGSNVLSIFKGETAAGLPSQAYRYLCLENNSLMVGGNGLGTIVSDNMTKYSDISGLTNTALPVDLGGGNWYAVLDSGYALSIPVFTDTKIFNLTFFERKRNVSVPQIFNGLIDISSATYLGSPYNVGPVYFRTDVLNGNNGADVLSAPAAGTVANWRSAVGGAYQRGDAIVDIDTGSGIVTLSVTQGAKLGAIEQPNGSVVTLGQRIGVMTLTGEVAISIRSSESRIMVQNRTGVSAQFMVSLGATP